MNFFHVRAFYLAVLVPASALRAPDAATIAAARKADSLRVVVEPAGDSSYSTPDHEPQKQSTLVAASGAMHATYPTSELLEMQTKHTASRAAVASSIVSFYLAHHATGSTIFVALFLMVTMLICMVFLLGSMLGSRGDGPEWSGPSAQDLLIKPDVAISTKQDTRLPPPIPTTTSSTQKLPPPMPTTTSGTQKHALAVPSQPRQPSTEPALKGQFIGSMVGGAQSFLTSFQNASTSSEPSRPPFIANIPSRRILIPEMIVQEGEGAQFFIDGDLAPKDQNGYLEVWRISSNHQQRMVMKLIFCEGYDSSNPEIRHQNGITLELPGLSNMPAAFLSTQFAQVAAGHSTQHAISQKRHITIFDTFTGSLDFKNPICWAEREERGTTVRNMAGEVLCSVSGGGYNTDFGNIVDGDGRLIATVSNRGHGLGGLGLVSGAWQKDRRVVNMCQGCDSVLIVCAIVSATKLN